MPIDPNALKSLISVPNPQPRARDLPVVEITPEELLQFALKIAKREIELLNQMSLTKKLAPVHSHQLAAYLKALSYYTPSVEVRRKRRLAKQDRERSAEELMQELDKLTGEEDA